MKEFFTGYRKTAMKPGEVLISLFVPFMRQNEYVAAYKQAKRRDDDIAIVNGCFRVFLDESATVLEADLAYGGLSATTSLYALH
jgi:xanthine dehydrogenase/oxidase